LTVPLNRSALPYDLLNWGGLLSGPCASVRDAILADGPHGSDNGPREAMRAAGCAAQADFNANPGADRLAAALLTLFVSAATVVLLALIAATVVAAQLVGVGLVAVSPFAFVGGILPGSGRQLLWRWLAAALRAVVAIVAMSLFLSLLLLTLSALLEATEGRALLERFGLLAVVTMLMAAARKRLLQAGQVAATGWGQRREAAVVGGTHGAGWMAPASVGGATGFALAELRRDGTDELRQTVRPVQRSLSGLAHRLPVPRRAPGLTSPRGARAATVLRGTSRAAARTVVGAAGGFVVTAPRAAAKGYVAASARRDAVVLRLREAGAGVADGAELWVRRARHPVDGFREEVARERARRAETQR
jgi:hypothetical protein